MTANGKPKIAFFDFTSCEGCQLTVVDSLQTHPELLEVVDIVQFREAMSERGEDYQIAFIEGSCTRQSDEARLQKIRKQAAVVVALGTCAHLGGVNALKALHPLEEVRGIFGAVQQAAEVAGAHERVDIVGVHGQQIDVDPQGLLVASQCHGVEIGQVLPIEAVFRSQRHRPRIVFFGPGEVAAPVLEEAR